MSRHFIDLLELTTAEAQRLIDQSIQLKRDEQNGRGRAPLLSGRTLGLMFEKPSLRTRVSFEAAIARLGGNAIFLRSEDVGLGIRESVSDFARVLSQYIDALAVRTFSHATVEELARHAAIPVINALSDASHPCQAMADFMTIQELRGTLEGQRLVFVGDGNNVARSLAVGLGPPGRGIRAGGTPRATNSQQTSARGSQPGFPRFPWSSTTIRRRPSKAPTSSIPMSGRAWGKNTRPTHRRKFFVPFQVNRRLAGTRRHDAIFLHCLPAHRGDEVTSSVLDGPRSQVILQAANRLHFQMALLVWLLGEQPLASTDEPERTS